MISKDLEERLRKEMRAKMNDWADHVATGACADFAEYKFITGEIAGMAFAERIFLDLIELRQREEDAK